MRSAVSVAAIVLSSFVALPVASAQVCPNATDTFWQNDTLPQVPTGSLPTAVIRGLCEGEAGAQVFTIPSNMGPQKINKVAAGFGHVLGSPGFNATANIEIYDGLTWNGSIPVLGAKVFDFNADAASSVQLLSHAINEVDLSAFNIVVGNTPSKRFVIAFRININPNGSCAAGYSANLLTDYNGGGGCTTTPQTSLIDISGLGWRDGAVAQIGGIFLCPLFFNGNWLIRTCTEDSGAQPTCQIDLGLGGPGDLNLEICGDPLSSGNFADFRVTNAQPGVLAFVLAGPVFNPTFVGAVFGVLVPLPPQLLVAVPTDVNGEITVANGVAGGNGPVSVYIQVISPDPAQIKGWEVSNCVQADLLP